MAFGIYTLFVGNLSPWFIIKENLADKPMSKNKTSERDEKALVDEMVEAAFEDKTIEEIDTIIEYEEAPPEPAVEDCPDGKCQVKRARPKIFLKDLKMGQKVMIDNPTIHGQNPFTCVQAGMQVKSSEGFTTFLTPARMMIVGEILE
jgi:hypothetical protein